LFLVDWLIRSLFTRGFWKVSAHLSNGEMKNDNVSGFPETAVGANPAGKGSRVTSDWEMRERKTTR